MIGVHIVKVKFLAADGAFVPLPLIGRKSVPAVKGPDAQFPLVPGQQILINTAFPGHVLVA